MKFVKGELKGLLEDPRPGTLAVAPRKPTRLPDRRGQRLGQDDLDRQAGPAAQGPGEVDRAGRLRHLPRRGRRAAHDLGRPRRLPRSSGAPRGRPGQRRPRRLRARPGPRHRRPDRRHRRPAAHPDPPDARAGEDPQRHPAARSPARRTRSCWSSTPPTARTPSARPRSSPRAIGCTGVILTKLDGTAKGGVVVAVRQTINLPVKFIGVGEAHRRPAAVRRRHVRRVAVH